MRKSGQDYRIALLLVAGDIAVINLSLLLSYWLRFLSGLFPLVWGVPEVSGYYHLLPVLTVILLFLMKSEKLYSPRSRLSIVDEFFTIVKVSTVGVIIFMAGTFFYREFSYSRAMLFILWVLLIFFLGLWRFAVNRIQFRLRKKRGKGRNLIVIGEGGMTERLIEHISDDPHWDYDIKGTVNITSFSDDKNTGGKCLGTINDLPRLLEEYDIDEVILTEIDLPRAVTMHVVLECEKRMIEFRLVADLLGMVTSRVDMRTIDGVPLLGLKESPLSEGYNRFIKRSMDLLFSLTGLILLFPFMAIIAVLVKATSPGPVFYMQKRIGEDGRRFTILKFRTMVDKAEKGFGRVWASRDDPRRTSIGAVLRKFNLDELPQLINVVKGEMSLVGPRPERPHFVGRFKEDIPRYMARHKIRSGITGWAQVNGLRGNTSIEERTKYDLYYIENWSLAFDLKILFMSFFAIKNAY